MVRHPCKEEDGWEVKGGGKDTEGGREGERERARDGIRRGRERSSIEGLCSNEGKGEWWRKNMGYMTGDTNMNVEKKI